MDKGDWVIRQAVLAALYLRGGPLERGALRRRNWPRVRAVLLGSSEVPAGSLPDALRRAGLYDEAAALSIPKVHQWGFQQAVAGCILTSIDPEYPVWWLRRLGDAAPPVLWRRGTVPPGPWFGMAGSRTPSAADASLASGLAAEAVRLGRGVFTGGAEGVDTLAAQAAGEAGGRVVVLLPCGLGRASSSPFCQFSLAAPDEPFSTGLAMERNLLIYASGGHAAVVAPRHRAGGSWTGSSDALRRGVCLLGVASASATPAVAGLCAMGAVHLSQSGGLGPFLDRYPLPGQLELFGWTGVRETLTA